MANSKYIEIDGKKYEPVGTLDATDGSKILVVKKKEKKPKTLGQKLAKWWKDAKPMKKFGAVVGALLGATWLSGFISAIFGGKKIKSGGKEDVSDDIDDLGLSDYGIHG
jgi:hypothetical protein